jgi:hypothetical protein
MLEVLLRESVATSPNRADLGNGADLAEVAIKIFRAAMCSSRDTTSRNF